MRFDSFGFWSATAKTALYFKKRDAELALGQRQSVPMRRWGCDATGSSLESSMLHNAAPWFVSPVKRKGWDRLYRSNSKKIANWPRLISSYFYVLSHSNVSSYFAHCITLPCSFVTSWITIQKKKYFTHRKKKPIHLLDQVTTYASVVWTQW